MSSQEVTGMSVGGRSIIENIGAKRISGTNLLTKGKFPFWVWWIEEISNLAVWEGTTKDSDATSWMGGLGYPVAGDTATRDTLSPFEGQKYFNTDTNLPEYFTEGGWSGTAPPGTPQPVAPRYRVPVEGTVLTSGRHHHIVKSGNYLLPNGNEDSQIMKEGQDIVVLVGHGLEVKLLAQGTSTFINSTGADKVEMALAAGCYYAMVYNSDGKFEVSDAIDLPFATDEEAAGRSVTDKIIAPSNLLAKNMDIDIEESMYPLTNMQSAFDFIEASILFNTSGIYGIIRGALTTGIIDDNPKLVVLYLDQYRVQLQQTPKIFYSSLVPTDPKDRTSYIKQWSSEIFELSSISDITSDGLYFRWLGYKSDGTLAVYQENPSTDPDVFVVARLFISRNNSVLSLATGGNDSIFIRPNFSDYDNERRAREPLKIELSLGPNEALSFNTSGGKIFGESVNYKIDPTNPHTLTVPSSNTVVFVPINGGSASNPLPPAPVTVIDPSQYWNGTAVDNVQNNKATVIRVMLTVQGTWIVQMGEVKYDNLNDAVAATDIAPFTELFVQSDIQELARIALRGDCVDLTDQDKAVWKLATSISGGIATPTALTDNYLLDDSTVAASSKATKQLFDDVLAQAGGGGGGGGGGYEFTRQSNLLATPFSGYSFFGTNYYNAAMDEQIYEGLEGGITRLFENSISSYTGTVLLGSPVYTSSGSVASIEKLPTVNINGVNHSTVGIADPNTYPTRNYYTETSSLLPMPEAPDGTQTYDTVTKQFVQHANIDDAFASETATNKVVTFAKVGIMHETFQMEVIDKVYRYGIVQDSLEEYEGITLLTRDDGFTRLGDWDETTGNYAPWDTLTDLEKAKYIEDPKHKLFFKGETLVQDCIRTRMFRGFEKVTDELQPALVDELAWEGAIVKAKGYSTDTAATIANFINLGDPFGTKPFYLACSNDGSVVYVVDDANNTFYFSNDGGANFTTKASSTNFPRGIDCSADGSIVYLAEADGQTVYKSVDFGDNWTATTSASTNLGGVACSDDGSIVYVGDRTGDTVFRSLDGGTTFTDLGLTFGGFQTPSSLACSSDGAIVYMLIDGSPSEFLYKSVDFGETVVDLGISTSNKVRGLACSSDGTSVYLTDEGNNALVYSTDGGTTFKVSGQNLGRPYGVACGGDGETVYVTNDSNDSLYKTTSFSGTAGIAYTGNVSIENYRLGEFKTLGNVADSFNGTCYTVPVAVVYQRNKGVYHKVLNPNGTSADLGGKVWGEDGFTPTTLKECFTQSNDSGNWNSSDDRGRPDDKCYNRVYSRDIVDERMSNEELSPHAHRSMYSRKLRSGKMYGAEGAPFSISRPEDQTSASPNTSAIFVDNIAGDYEVGDYCTLIDDANNQRMRVQITSVSATNMAWDSSRWGLFVRPLGVIYVIREKANPCKSIFPTWTTIFAVDTVFHTAFPDGIEGRVSEVKPNGSITEFPLGKNIKTGNYPTVYVSRDGGATWDKDTTTPNYEKSSVNEFATLSSGDIMLVTFETYGEVASLDLVEEAYDIGDVIIGNTYLPSNGGALTYDLIRKPATGKEEFPLVIPITQYKLDMETYEIDVAKHDSILNQLELDETSKAVKYYDYLSTVKVSVGQPPSGLGKLSICYKELVLSNGNWGGDNSQFESVDSQDFYTNTRGDQGIRGTSSVRTQHYVVVEPKSLF